jgi:hypothetical protein
MTDPSPGLRGTIGHTLPSDLRGQLEAAVRAAREATEAGAHQKKAHYELNPQAALC